MSVLAGTPEGDQLDELFQSVLAVPVHVYVTAAYALYTLERLMKGLGINKGTLL